MQRANSPSGTEGYVKLHVPGVDGEFRIDFDCPNSGDNKCKVSGNIDGLTVERKSFSGKSGRVASCTVLVKNA